MLNLAVSRCSRTTTAEKCTKKRYARAKLLFCLSEPIDFLTFSFPLPSTSPLRKLPKIKHGRVSREYFYRESFKENKMQTPF